MIHSPHSTAQACSKNCPSSFCPCHVQWISSRDNSRPKGLRFRVLDQFDKQAKSVYNVCFSCLGKLQSFVEQVMDLVEMKSLEFALVGLPAISGLSTEQRKRLTIAVELVANPSIIFMDEPTSGLDARAAAIVMRTVRNTVDTGRTVVCTIHQPSIDIFEAFDEVCITVFLPFLKKFQQPM
jgi:ABC-type phosphate/phosphonate transport system ATPase subunit